MKNLFLLSSCLVMILAIGCQMPHSTRIHSSAAPDEPALIAEFEESFPVGEVRAAVLKSLGERGWSIGTASGRKVEAYLVHRGFESNIQLHLEGSRITIYSDSWRIDREGRRLNPEHPGGWFRNIERDVRRSLGLPVPLP